MSEPKPRAVAVVQACLESGDESAWGEFVRLFQPLIASVILRVMQRFGRPDRVLADDLVQEAYVRLCKDNCKALRSFEHRHEESIFAFVKVVAGSVAMDHFRARRAEKRAAEVETRNDEALTAGPAPPSNVHGSVLLSEIASHLELVTNSDRDRAIFWLYYQQGYTAKDIASIPRMQLTAKGVESLLLRLTQAVRRQMNPDGLKNTKRGKGLSPSSSVGEVR
jgi:RNA polymerase sigma-70 factor (ECF subfamily)